jgi:TonB family protein
MSSIAIRASHIAGGGALALMLVLGSASTCLADSPAQVDRSRPTPAPNYPDSAQAAGEQGDVLLDVYVSSAGHPRKFRVNQSSGFGDLDNAAAEAVANWQFVPAVRGGDTVSDWTTVKIHFELPKAAEAAPTATPAPQN